VRQLVDIQTVANALGVKVSTVYGMVSRREIPFTKVGRLTKFDPASIDAWLEQHTFSPIRPPSMALKKATNSLD
jgi:excisionase family DNA binding protein